VTASATTSQGDFYGVRNDIGRARLRRLCRVVLEAQRIARSANKKRRRFLWKRLSPWPTRVWVAAGRRFARARGGPARAASKECVHGPDVLFALGRDLCTDRGVRGRLDQLEHLLSDPVPRPIPLLALDPLYAPIAGESAFERLVAATSCRRTGQRAKLTHSLWGRGRRRRYPSVLLPPPPLPHRKLRGNS